MNNNLVCKTHGANCDRRCIDPNVDNGMMTKVWGPTGWLFLHCITFGYPYTINPINPDHAYKKQHYKTFFEMIGYVLPCKYCRESYVKFMKEIPIDQHLDSRKDLCEWLYLIHNKVNDKLGVPKESIPSFNEVQDFYEQFRAKCKKTTEKERELNKEKGCIRPADGTPKKCLISVVACKDGDITARANSIVYKENFNDKNIKLLGGSFDYITDIFTGEITIKKVILMLAVLYLLYIIILVGLRAVKKK